MARKYSRSVSHEIIWYNNTKLMIAKFNIMSYYIDINKIIIFKSMIRRIINGSEGQAIL